jgi:hypothetical protein
VKNRSFVSCVQLACGLVGRNVSFGCSAGNRSMDYDDPDSDLTSQEVYDCFVEELNDDVDAITNQRALVSIRLPRNQH